MSALLVCCMAIDSADENITVNQSMVNDTNTTLVGGVHYDDKIVDKNVTGIAKVHNIVHIKPKYPTISMWAKPSCGCKYSYKYWYYREFVNYCPNCHHYNVLVKNPKGTYEKEWTCKRCSSDFCGVCGKEKYSWSRVYLRRA